MQVTLTYLLDRVDGDECNEAAVADAIADLLPGELSVNGTTYMPTYVLRDVVEAFDLDTGDEAMPEPTATVRKRKGKPGRQPTMSDADIKAWIRANRANGESPAELYPRFRESGGVCVRARFNSLAKSTRKARAA